MNKASMIESIEKNVPDDVVAGFSVFLKENGAHTILTNMPLEQSFVILSAIVHDMLDTIADNFAAISEAEHAKKEDKMN